MAASFSTATRQMRITAIIGRLEANNGTAATLAPVKAASGTAVAAGTPLTSNSMDLHGDAADTNQTLTLVTAACVLAAGDSVAIQTSGA